jgi:hypothetical protein
MNIIAAFIIALISSLIILFAAGTKGRSSVFPLVLFFVILFLAGVATQYWITPFGPVYWGVSWFPLIFIILVFSILLSAQPLHRRSGEDTETSAISIFIWLLVVLLLIAALTGFFYKEPPVLV